MPDDDDDWYNYYSDDPDSYDPPSDDGEDIPEQTTPEPTPPKPVRLIVDPIGHNGRYSLAIQVLSEQGNGFGIQITIKIEETGERGGKVSMLQTDNNGFLFYEARPFREEERDFFIEVMGVTGLWAEFTLDGPERKRPKPPPIKLVPGGFWANFWYTIEENKKRRESQD